MDHFLKGEWDDAQVDAGRFCEAALRYLEWKMAGTFTAIDGKSKPNRKTTVNKAQQDTSLAPSLRAQIPQSIELTMDFRNNRNTAHLGNIDANKMDATCVVQNVTWVVGEIVRLETQKPPAEVQRLLDQLAERHVPLVQTVNGRPVILDPGMGASDKALVLLYQQAKPVPIHTLRQWAEYGNSSRWTSTVIRGLEKKRQVHVDSGNVALLIPGEAKAQQLILDAGGL
ncbi:hypothetical protein [Solirubrobacter pauli]|nr:hypothetical protein [Solirubrobacter pauli]